MARDSLKSISKLLDRANKQLSVEEMFLTDLKRSIEISNDKNSRKPSQAYKPSSMRCIRNMYYQVIGTEPDKSDSNYCSVGICNSGSDIHVRIQTAVDEMKDNGFDCEYIDVAEYVRQRHLDYLDIVSKSGMETKLYHKGLNISFLCDGIIRYRNHYYILELKTEASFKWTQRKGVDPSHYDQGTAYSSIFNIPEVLFVYISRDVLDMKAYLFTPTQEMKDNLLNKIHTCDKYVEKKETPPKPEDADRKMCNYCSYKSTCDKEL